MSLPSYPKYKPSGVEWLGQVPEEWKVAPLKVYASHNDDVLDEATAPNLEITYVDISNVDGTKGIIAKEPLQFSDAPSRARRRVKHGDVIVSTVRTYLKAVARIRDPEENLIVSTGFAVIRPKGSLQSDFLGHLLSSSYFVEQVIARSTGVSYPAINASELVAIPVAVPPGWDQESIGAFLDRETAKIDALVAEQQRLIELLKEKRQALISHAVTKGLDPKVPLKPSGIEWLREVPASWSVAPVAARYSVQLGKMLDTAKISGRHLRPYLRVIDVQWGEINTEDLPEMDFDEDARQKFRLAPGDLLVNEGGSYPGRSAIWRGRIGECYYQKALHRVRALDQQHDSTRFLFYVMYWAATQGVFIAGGNETTIEHLPAEKLRRYRFAFPPIGEQLEIAAFLDGEAERIDSVGVMAQRTIDLLQERRTALISAAVTGQIDVCSLGEKQSA